MLYELIIPTLPNNRSILNNSMESFKAWDKSRTLKFNVVCRDQTFEKNVNEGIRTLSSETEAVVIGNDDVFAIGDWQGICSEMLKTFDVINGTGMVQCGDLFPFWFCVMKRKVIDEVGLLDEEYEQFSSDHDYIMQMMEKGFKIANYRLPLLHIESYSTKKLENEQELMKKNRERFKSKWRRE